MASPSMKLCRPSPMMIIQATGLILFFSEEGPELVELPFMRCLPFSGSFLLMCGRSWVWLWQCFSGSNVYMASSWTAAISVPAIEPWLLTSKICGMPKARSVTSYSTWPSAKVGQALEYYYLEGGGGGGGEIVIGWICSCDLFKTYWKGLHKVLLPISIAKKSRMFLCVLSLPQWGCYHDFELFVFYTNVHAG